MSDSDFQVSFQGWRAGVGAGAGRSGVFLAPWSRSRLKKKTRSRSRLEKKVRSRIHLKNQPAPQPCWKIKSIRKLYFCYSSVGKIVSFYGEIINYFIFLQLYLSCLRGKEYFVKINKLTKLKKSQEPESLKNKPAPQP